MSFTSEQDEELIEWIRMHPILFDPRLEEHKDQFKKDCIWSKIAEQLDKTGDDCKKRWRSIRDNYKKHKRNEEREIGETVRQAKNRKQNSILKQLNFLDVVPSKRHLYSDMSSDINHFQPIASRIKLENDEDTIETSIEDMQDDGNCYFEEDLEKKRPKSDCVYGQNISLSKRRQKDRNELITNLEDAKDDEIDVFFKAMALTVKKFPEHLRIEAKQQIFQCITELEIRSLRQEDPYS